MIQFVRERIYPFLPGNYSGSLSDLFKVAVPLGMRSGLCWWGRRPLLVGLELRRVRRSGRGALLSPSAAACIHKKVVHVVCIYLAQLIATRSRVITRASIKARGLLKPSLLLSSPVLAPEAPFEFPPAPWPRARCACAWHANRGRRVAGDE